MLGDHIGTDVWVTAHDFPLFLTQGPGLIEYVVPNSYLPKIVQGAGCPNQLALSVAELKVFTQRARQLGDSDRVGFGITIASVETLSSQVQRLVFKHSLALNVSDCSADRDDETEQVGSDDIPNWPRLRGQQ